MAWACAEQRQVAADVGREVDRERCSADADAAAEHRLANVERRQDACVVAQAEAAFALEYLWWGDGVLSLLPPGGAQLGQDGFVGVGDGGLAV